MPRLMHIGYAHYTKVYMYSVINRKRDAGLGRNKQEERPEATTHEIKVSRRACAKSRKKDAKLGRNKKGPKQHTK